MSSRWFVVVLLLVATTSSGVARSVTAPVDSVGLPAGPSNGATGYAVPVTGATSVLRPFEAPSTVYSAGHRGVDLADPGGSVLAAAAGTVTFAGPVGGRGIVVIAHPDGVSTEYEPVVASVHRGQAVARGEPIGQISGTHGACPPDSCLHWGARRAGSYFDPMSLLGGLGVIRLIPWG